MPLLRPPFCSPWRFRPAPEAGPGRANRPSAAVPQARRALRYRPPPLLRCPPPTRAILVEATNRRVLALNLRLDDAVIRPAAVLYRKAVGRWARTRIRNFLENLSEPAVAANALLQARPLAAHQSVMRFAINSTLGLGGLFDMAQFGGPPRQVIDFGQTLYRWGVPDGPYLMVPVAGPSTPREFVGTVGNGFLNPVGWLLPFGYNAGRTATYGLDERERNVEALDEIRNGSLDVYARLRSLWRQHRDAELGRTSSEGLGLDILEDPGAAPRGGGG